MTSLYGRDRSRLLFVRTLTLALCVLGLAGTAHAQVLYGSIVGNVADASKAAVPGATVTIVHKETSLSRESTTGNDGDYRFVNVQPGTYTVRVALAGFKETVKENVPVSANTVSRVDLGLEVGQLTEAVTVQSEQKLLQTDSGSVTSELRSKEIESLPLGNYRNYQTLLNLVPGTTPAAFQNAVTDTPARALSTNVNGTARNNNNTRLDGTTNVFIWLPHHAVYVAPAETVDTVNISTNNFDAEQGMAGGAAVTVLTKSGTNEFHGSAFALHENEGLRAQRRVLGEATAALKNAAQAWPEDLRIRRELATVLFLANDSEAARPLLEDLLKREPDSAELSLLLGETWLRMLEPAKAIPLLEAAVKQDPKLLPAQAALGRAYLEGGAMAKAVAPLQAALHTDVDGSLHYQLARAYRATGRPELAAQALRRFEELRKAQEAAEESLRDEFKITPP